MRFFCLFLACLLVTFCPARAGSTPKIQIFLRVHVQTSGDGLSGQQATPINLPPNGETIQIRTMPEVSEANLIGIKTDTSGNVRLFFDHTGTVNLSAVTAQNQGRLLVVLLNGNVIYAPIIDEQITSGELDIPHALPAQAIQLLEQTAQANVKENARIN